MEMGVGTKLNRDGSGTFSLAVAADKEFIDGLSQADRQSGGRLSATGLTEFENFFGSLKQRGWRTKKTETKAGDVALAGSCAFRDAKGFDACLSQVSSAEGGGRGLRFKDAGMSFDFGTKKGLFKTHTFFSGRVNLAGDDRDPALARQIQQLAAEVFTFEVRAELPGSTRIVSGNGQIRDGVAVWKPKVGEHLSLRAESDAYNPAAFVVGIIPLIGLLGLGMWALTRRRRPAGDAGGFVPVDRASEGPVEEPALEHGAPT
jgi:hypothetical protein